MPALNQDLIVYANNPTTILFNCRNKDGSVPNLTNATLRWWMGRDQYASGADVFIEKSFVSGVINGMQPTSTPGQMAVQLQPGDTVNVPPSDEYYHEAEVLLQDGTGGTASVGSFKLRSTIIRP